MRIMPIERSDVAGQKGSGIGPQGRLVGDLDPLERRFPRHDPRPASLRLESCERCRDGCALGTSPENYLRTLAYRLRQPARGLKIVKSGPVKEVVKLHNEADWTELPIPFHKDMDAAPYITAMNIIRDPETGFYNSCHAGTHAVGPRRG